MSKIMVIDDECDMLDSICGALEDEGYEVEGCASATQALTRLSDGCFSLVISDVMMPHMTGFEVVRNIRQMPGIEATPVLLMSAATPDKKQLQMTQCNAFLRKPFDLDSFLALVDRLKSASYAPNN